MAINGSVIFQPQFLEDYAGPQHAFRGFFGLAGHVQRGSASQFFDEFSRPVTQVIVARMGDNPVQVAGNRAHVFVDRPLVVIEDHDKALRIVGDIVERFIGNPAGEGGVAGQSHHVFPAACQVASHCHAERRR